MHTKPKVVLNLLTENLLFISTYNRRQSSFKVGVFMVFYIDGSNSDTKLHGGNRGGKASFSPLKSVKRQKAPLGRSMSTNFVADCRLFTVSYVFVTEHRDCGLTITDGYLSFKSTDAAGPGVNSGGEREARKITVPRPLIRCRDILPYRDLKGCLAGSLWELL